MRTLHSLEQSVERLGLDRVDVVFIHDPDDHWRDAIEHAYPAAELRDQGVVSSIGAGMNQSEMLARFVRHTDMDLLMLAGRYTLLEQGALDELLPLCVERDVGVVAAGVFNSGLLARDDPPDGVTYNYGVAPASIVEQARRIGEACRNSGTSLPTAALAFPLAHPAVASVCIGARSPDQVRRNVEQYRRGVDASTWEALRSEDLLRGDAPTS